VGADCVREVDPAGLLATHAVVRGLETESGALPRMTIEVEADEFRRRLLMGPARRLARMRAAREPSLGDVVRRSGVRTTPPAPPPDVAALVVYRSDTAQQGGVVLTHRNLLAHAFQARLWIPDVQAGKERILLADAVHYDLVLGAGLLGGVLAAATLILLDTQDPAAVAATIAREQPTLWPTQVGVLEAVVRVRKRDLTSLRVVLASGAELPAEVAATAEQRTRGARVRLAYGCPQAPLSHAQPVYGRVEPGSFGLPVTDTVAIVVDDRGRICPPGQPGQLLVHGPQTVAGDGWVATGVRATMDEHGVFHPASHPEAN
jgi:long-chain acyl-CoA synthetase